MEGTIFSIEEFSVHDGPGIRTTVFLKGCPLRCSWCHNPEGQSPHIQIVRSPNGCIRCGNCIKTSVIQNGESVFTEESIKNCPLNLIRKCGERISTEVLCNQLLRNKPFYGTEGGVTFSGGEPFVQSDFLLDCLRYLKGRLHTAIQTCGYCKEETFRHALKLTDYVLYDLKLIDEDQHKRYTGVSNQSILHNFTILAASRTPFVIRVPLIPGVIDTEENLTQIATLLSAHGIHYVELLPYNKMAGAKYKLLNKEYMPDFDPCADSNPHLTIFEHFGIQAKLM